MATWTPPPGSTWPTSNRLIRMFAGSSLRQDSGRCPYRTAMKARTGLRLPRGPLAAYKTDPRETFNLGPTGTALDLIEHDAIEPEEALRRALAATAERPAADPGLAAWTRFAVEHYSRGRPRELFPLAGTWVVVTKLERQDARGAKRYEQCVWGRSYISADGLVRELCVPVARHKDEERSDRNAGDDADRADRAAAAYVVGFGDPYRLPGQRSWSSDAQPFQDAGEAAWSRPQEVRISEVSCLDGTRRELLRDSPAEIERRYADHGAPQLTAAVSGKTFLPGNDCADCKYAPTCPALKRLGGILGIEDDAQPRRSWSVTNGRSYMGRPGHDESCPARERLRRLRLPDPEGRSLTPHVVRGHAVHAWIQQCHENRPGVACRPEDAPDGTTSWSVGRWTVPQEQAELGAQMVAAHARHCPYRLSSVDEVIHERTLVLHDTAADVLVIAKTDMLYRDGPSWVYRETKTDARRRRPLDTGTGIFRERPQLALAVLLSTSSLVNDDTSGARVELEVLGPAGGLTIIDPFDPENRMAARQALHELSAAWHADTTAQTRPGAHCLTCDMAVWCQPTASSELLAPGG